MFCFNFALTAKSFIICTHNHVASCVYLLFINPCLCPCGTRLHYKCESHKVNILNGLADAGLY